MEGARAGGRKESTLLRLLMRASKRNIKPVFRYPGQTVVSSEEENIFTGMFIEEKMAPSSRIYSR